MRAPASAAAAAAVLALLAGTAEAQLGPDDWTTFASGDEVLALAVDPTSAGRVLWAGTEGGGVVAWNLASGTFEQYLYPSQPGLASNDVRDVAFDAEGDAWLATPAGVVHAPRSGSWLTYTTADGLPSLDVTAVAVDESGVVWAGTYDRAIATLRPPARTWEAVERDAFVPGDDAAPREGPGGWRVADIAVGPDGRVWLAHGREDAEKPALSVFDESSGTWHHVSAITPGEDPTTGPSTDQVLSIAFDEEGTLWVGTWGRGVQTMDPITGDWGRHGERDGTCGDNVWAVAAALDRVWIACASDPSPSGVAYWDGRAWTRLRALDDAGDPTGLPDDVVRAIAVADGAAYFGTNGPGFGGRGIGRFDDEAFGDRLTTDPLSPPSNDVTAVTVDPASGDVWVGTRGQGLARYDGSRWDVYTAETTSGDLAGDTITDLLVDEGVLWVASTQTLYRDGAYQDGGVSALDLDTGAWRAPLRPTPGGLPDGDVAALGIGPGGRLWIGLGAASGGVGGNASTVQQGDGVAVYDPVAGRFTDFHVYTSDDRGPAGNTVLDLAFDGAEMWLATSYHATAGDTRKRGGGVSATNGATWVSWKGGDDGFRTYHGSGDPSDQDPFITGDVRSVAVDASGVTWAGTWVSEGADVIRTWPYVDAVVDYRSGAQWLFEVFAGAGWVSSLAIDSAGNVWAATTRGHAVQEADLTTMRRTDTSAGGLRLRTGAAWESLVPSSSGLASNAITVVAVDPRSGDVWIGHENGGLSRFAGSAAPAASATPCVDCPTSTPGSLPTGPLVLTVPPTTPAPGTPPVTPGPPGFPTPPAPQPPPEVPEPTTWLLFGGALAAVAIYAAAARRRAMRR